MRSYLDGMLRYFEFSGRSTRMQYWIFFLIHTALFVGAIYLDVVVGKYHPSSGFSGLPATVFVSFIHAFPAWTLQVRRLHDIDKSGWWLLLNVVPFGGFVLLYWACCASEPGSNSYDGPAPRSYEPRFKSRPVVPRRSTIPRDIRMGSGRTPSVGGPRSEPTAGRFI